MKLNTFPFHSMQEYMERFSPFNETFEDHHISDVYRLIERRREGGVGLIEYVCSMLTNDGVKRGCAFMDRFVQWADEENKDYGTQYLAVLYLNVYGKEIQREERYSPFILTGKRVKQVWINEGKDEEGEWERRWREAGDIMNEEDVMETSIMHLCIPDYESETGAIIPHYCSLNALCVCLNDESDRRCPYHFPVYQLNKEPTNVLIIRNLPSRFDIESEIGNELTDMINNISEVDYIEQEEGKCNPFEYDEHSRYEVIRVTLLSDERAGTVVMRLDGSEFYGTYMSVKQGIYTPPPSSKITTSTTQKISQRRKKQ